ncbi:MAG: copper resistance protein CopC [Longimicrobiales bacterium]|nr:copper resistance protein CopC [Longimicrobiales bacterium]
MKPVRTWVAAVALFLAAVAWTVPHLDLVDSHPKPDQALAAPPTEVWLKFSTAPDLVRSTFSLQGPAGAVELGAVAAGSAPEILRAEVKGPVVPGSYTVSWVGVPPGEHAVRGRFTFTVGGP